MKIGMLWFDNDTKCELSGKIERAAVYYQKKYGRRPDLCFVHPSMVNKNGLSEGKNGEKAKPLLLAGNVEVRTTRSVLPNHLWIGINNGYNQPKQTAG
ncbi:MAG: hypothetical protein ACNA8H_00745 [Anaerolineales bacterium]